MFTFILSLCMSPIRRPNGVGKNDRYQLTFTICVQVPFWCYWFTEWPTYFSYHVHFHFQFVHEPPSDSLMVLDTIFAMATSDEMNISFCNCRLTDLLFFLFGVTDYLTYLIFIPCSLSVSVCACAPSDAPMVLGTMMDTYFCFHFVRSSF